MILHKLYNETEDDQQDFCDTLNKYFDECQKKGEPVNIAGCCVALGITRSQWDTQSTRPKYADYIAMAKAQIESTIINGALRNKLNGYFSIFYLKALHGFIDKQTIEEIKDKVDDDDLDKRIDQLLDKAGQRFEKIATSRSKTLKQQDKCVASALKNKLTLLDSARKS